MSVEIQLIQTIYWLALATWFGGTLFLAIAAPIVFRAVREMNPVLPGVLSVNLEGQHSTLLAGHIILNVMTMLTRVAVGCAAALLGALVLQWVLLDLGRNLGPLALRSGFFIFAVAVLLYDWRVTQPRIERYRREYIDHADEPDIANPARDQFDRYHRESVTLLSIQLFLLLGMILFGMSDAVGTIRTLE